MTEDVCRSYMGNLEGKFYKLEGLSEEDQAELAKVDGLMSEKRPGEDSLRMMFE